MLFVGTFRQVALFTYAQKNYDKRSQVKGCSAESKKFKVYAAFYTPSTLRSLYATSEPGTPNLSCAYSIITQGPAHESFGESCSL